jgi:ribosomal peptide maturation radical SAM protein 1
MYKIHLINMPFAALPTPSIALMQLKSVTEERFGEQASVEVSYVNHDFAAFIGLQTYNLATSAFDSHTTGVGDWLFRQAAFPDQEDNTESYFNRYYPHRDERTRAIKQMILKIRHGLGDFLNQIIRTYRLDQADLIGFTSMFTQTVSSLALARLIKRHNPKSVIIMGGANCESPMGQEIVKSAPQIDFVFSGPALKSFPEFLQYQIEGEYNKRHSIKGVFSKRNCSLTPLGCGGATGEELPIDEEVRLDYEPFLQTIEKRFNRAEVSPVLLFETSRGCWWGEKSHCTFCGLNGMSMNYRAMSPEKAIAQFKGLFSYADRCNNLESVDNILPKNYIREVFPKLSTPENLTIFYEVKADLSAQDFEALAKAGVRSIQPGIESLATSTLKLMRKGTSVFTNLMLLKNCLVYGIQPAWNLLIGFPGETEAVYQKYVSDLPWLVHLPPPSGVYPVRFDRFSPYFVQAEKYKLSLRPLDYYQLIYPIEERGLSNLAYYFVDANLDAPYFKSMTQWIDKLKELISNWNERWHERSGRNRPKLYCKYDGSVALIHDSRRNGSVEYRISEAEYRVLERLTTPGRLPDITQTLSSISEREVEDVMRSLLDRKLIFLEAERYISLVLFPAAQTGLSSDVSLS